MDISREIKSRRDLKLMEKNPIQAEIEISPKRSESNLINIVEDIYATALTGESYDDVAAASVNVETLQSFLRKTAQIPFVSFHEMIEGATILNQLSLTREEKDKQTKDWATVMAERSPRFSPRVADLYQALLAEIIGEPYEAHFKITREKITELSKDGDLAVLFSSEISWDLKLNRIETRLVDYLLGVRALDKGEGKEMADDLRQWRAEQLKQAPARPPERRNESQPGVDPMERLKQGERAPAIWTIDQAWGGYYKEQSFSRWDETHKRWVEDKYIYSDVQAVPLSGNKNPQKGPIDFIMKSTIMTGTRISLPVPYTHDFHKGEVGAKDYLIQKDQNGDLVIFTQGSGEAIDITVTLAPNPNKKLIAKEPGKIQAPDMPSEFTEETNQKLQEVTDEKHGNIARAKAIRSYVVRRIRYLAPQDRAEAERYNNIYRTSHKGFAGAVDEIKKGDCDVVNTYFAALCARLNIPVRHCVGHMVKGKDKNVVSTINAGTGHGWSEVWDEIKKEWVRMDATPAGDPNLEENDERKSGEAVPGDYGEQEAVRPSDEQLEKLRQKLAERKEQLSYTKEERQLAETAGIDLKEARQIVKEIHTAEQTRLPSGELLVDVLATLFNAIVESRKSTAKSYTGPVRRSEGGEAIQQIVRHTIGVLSGENDPPSREKLKKVVKEEIIPGGFDLYMIGDKSGSMQRTDESAERLWQMQRRSIYLIFASLYRFERNLERAGLPKENALPVRTQCLSFRGSDNSDLDVDKPLSAAFTASDKVKLWHSLTQQGSGNGDVAALSYLYEQIKIERERTKESGVGDNRLRLIFACSDGGPDDPVKVQLLVEALGKLQAVVVGIGLTETAAAVPIIYNTSYSRGDIARTIDDLPIVIVKHVVLEAIKLFPAKAKVNAKKLIEDVLKKFKNF